MPAAVTKDITRLRVCRPRPNAPLIKSCFMSPPCIWFEYWSACGYLEGRDDRPDDHLSDHQAADHDRCHGLAAAGLRTLPSLDSEDDCGDREREPGYEAGAV